jgi:hypothetical protein
MSLPLLVFIACFREIVNEKSIESGRKGQVALHEPMQERIASDGTGATFWMHIQRSETTFTHVAAFRD